jgi:predicted metal-binding membrane protein
MTDIDAAGPLPGVPPRIRSRGVARFGVIQRLRRLDVTHPVVWVALAAAAAWSFVVMTHAQPHPVPHAHAGHGGSSHAASMGYGALAMMTIAMMLPLSLGWVRDVARSASSRHRATGAFLAGYLAVWMLAVALIDAAWRLASSRIDGNSAAMGVMLTAALWEIAAAVYPSIRGCDRSMTSVARGWRANLASAGLGVSSGIRCVLSCWALMAACVAFAHDLRVMVGLFIVQLIGRYRPIRIHLRSGNAHHPAAPMR